VSVEAQPDPQTSAPLASAWATVTGPGSCAPQNDAGPSYALSCTNVPSGEQQLVVHVKDVDGAITDVPITINVA